MVRNRKTDQSIVPAEAATATAIAESEPADLEEKTKEEPSFAERVGHGAERAATPNPFKIAGGYAAAVHLFECRRDRQTAVKFDPSQPVIGKVKDAGYRWNLTDRVWMHPVPQESAMTTRIEAERLNQEVRQMTWQEKGLGAAQELPF